MTEVKNFSAASGVQLKPAYACSGIARRRMPRMNEVIGTVVNHSRGYEGQRGVVVFVPSQDAKPFAIRCDDNTGWFDAERWPDGRAIWNKYCR